MGVWIEITVTPCRLASAAASLPLWECGLKLARYGATATADTVTPLVGVWIEIIDCPILKTHVPRHSPCGSVD